MTCLAPALQSASLACGRVMREVRVFLAPRMYAATRRASHDVLVENGALELRDVHHEAGRHLLAGHRANDCDHSHLGLFLHSGQRGSPQCVL